MDHQRHIERLPSGRVRGLAPSEASRTPAMAACSECGALAAHGQVCLAEIGYRLWVLEDDGYALCDTCWEQLSIE